MCILTLVLSYLVGAIPTGYWFAKYLFGVDVTVNGSGNIGATNVARVLGCPNAFFVIFLLDFAKAFGALFLCNLLCKPWLLLAAVFLLVGNGCSIFLRFRGGKSVATTVGILAFLFPTLCLSFLVLWIASVLIIRQVAIASLGATLSLIPAYFLLIPSYERLEVIFLFFLVAWIFFRHRKNIKEIVGL